MDTKLLEPIPFWNNKLGNCLLVPLVNKELKSVFQKEMDKEGSDVAPFIKKLLTDQSIQLWLQTKKEHLNNIHTLFLIMNNENLIGMAGYFFNNDQFLSSELFWYFKTGIEDIQSMFFDLINILVNRIFEIPHCTKIYINNSSIKYLSLKAMNQIGFLENKCKQFELSRFDRGLYLLTEIIQKEKNYLAPRVDMARINIERTRRLWFAHFNKGIFLSNGGVDNSFIDMNKILSHRNLSTFNMYRGDRPETTIISEMAMKKFLVEEGAISNVNNLPILSVSLCLGSHEGFSRVARILHHSNFNNGMLYPEGGYAFLAAAASTMKPVAYDVHLIAINSNNGEKINFDDLNKLRQKHPNARTLFLEMKTTAGVNYTVEEYIKLIHFCKKNGIFLLLDAAHFKMDFKSKTEFPDVSNLCLQNNFHDFAVFYTASKTYGFERGRVGFILISSKSRIYNFQAKIERDLFRIVGSINDLHYELTFALIQSDLRLRKEFLKKQNEKHRFNMNLMIAYLEGTKSLTLDSDLVEKIASEIPISYQNGMPLLKLVAKPECGIQLKIDTSRLKNKYFTNIRMFNSEIFSYALNKVCNVVALHSYQIMDTTGFGMRLSFSLREDVHQGMQAIFRFINILSDTPTLNKFMPDLKSIEELIFDKKIQYNIQKSYIKPKDVHLLYDKYKKNILKQLPSYLNLRDEKIMETMNSAASKIQHAWRLYSKKDVNNTSKKLKTEQILTSKL